MINTCISNPNYPDDGTRPTIDDNTKPTDKDGKDGDNVDENNGEIIEITENIDPSAKANTAGSTENESESDTGAIIGLSLGGIAFFLTITIIVIYCSRKNLAKTEQGNDDR